MGLLDSLAIGHSGVTTSQASLHVIGHNVVNAGTPDYARQSPELAAIPGGTVASGIRVGGGVVLADVRRQVDEALNARLRIALGDQASSAAAQENLSRIEARFNELTEDDVSTLLSEFFNAVSEVRTIPDNISLRQALVESGATLAFKIGVLHSDLMALRSDLDTQLKATVTEADRLSKEIAELNGEIVTAEASGGAAGLRNQRDSMLRKLGELIEIRTFEQPSGSMNVMAGNVPLVIDGHTRGLTTETELLNGQLVDTVRFADDGSQVDIRGGRIQGIVKGRDRDIQGAMDELNTLASQIIFEFNKIHSGGQGLVGFESVRSEHGASDSAAALNSSAAGLPFTPVNGTFLLHVTDVNTDQRSEHLIEIDLDGVGADTSLDALSTAIDAVGNLTSMVNADGTLSITAAAGFELTFSEDSSGLLAALGINNFFAGRDAADFAVMDEMSLEPQRFAAASNHLPGNGANASKLEQLRSSALTGLRGISVQEYYHNIVNGIAVSARSAADQLTGSISVVEALQAQRESVSGVSIDEEAINLIRFQRAFQGSAKFISLVDDMLDELMALV